MKVIKCDLPAEHKELQILTLADWHMGDPRSDFKRIQEWLDYLEKTPNAYAIINGDLMDCATRTSVGDIYSTHLNPMEQLKRCVELFEPVKHKLLAVDGGNHEHRIWKQDGIDVTAMMCAQLGLDCYSETGAFLFVRFGAMPARRYHGRKCCYTIYAQHGSGGGRKEGGKIQRLADLAAICDADVYIHSHTHLPAVFKTGYFRVDTSNSAIAHVTKLFVNTSATLEYGGYAEGQGMKPTSTDTPLIILDGTKKRATALL